MSAALPSAPLSSPRAADFTQNERAWITFLRIITDDRDPPPTLARVQTMRRALAEPRFHGRIN